MAEFAPRHGSNLLGLSTWEHDVPCELHTTDHNRHPPASMEAQGSHEAPRISLLIFGSRLPLVPHES
jgi:hypothetical protein